MGFLESRDFGQVLFGQTARTAPRPRVFHRRINNAPLVFRDPLRGLFQAGRMPIVWSTLQESRLVDGLELSEARYGIALPQTDAPLFTETIPPAGPGDNPIRGCVQLELELSNSVTLLTNQNSLIERGDRIFLKSTLTRPVMFRSFSFDRVAGDAVEDARRRAPNVVIPTEAILHPGTRELVLDYDDVLTHIRQRIQEAKDENDNDFPRLTRTLAKFSTVKVVEEYTSAHDGQTVYNKWHTMKLPFIERMIPGLLDSA